MNSCGLCGSAYQEPGASRAGTRKSRAPSGVERVSVGVSISTKSRPCSTSRAARFTSLRSRMRRAPAPAGAGRGSGSAAAPPRRPRRARRSGTAAAPPRSAPRPGSATTSTSPVGRAGFSLPSGRRRTSPVTRSTYSLRSPCADRLVADHHLDDARGVAQVEEGHPAVVAAAGHPAGEGDGAAGVPGAQACLPRGCAARWSSRSRVRADPGRGPASRGTARPVDPTRAVRTRRLRRTRTSRRMLAPGASRCPMSGSSRLHRASPEEVPRCRRSPPCRGPVRPSRAARAASAPMAAFATAGRRRGAGTATRELPALPGPPTALAGGRAPPAELLPVPEPAASHPARRPARRRRLHRPLPGLRRGLRRGARSARTPGCAPS